MDKVFEHPRQRLEDWVAAIGGPRLPRLPRHTLDYELPPRDLAAQIYVDPALVLGLIHDVNTHASRHLDSGVHSMEEAVLLRGVRNIRAVADGLPQAEQALTRANYRGYLFTCERAIHAACQARRWAWQLADLLPNEVYTAALLRHTAELVMWSHDDGQVMRTIHEMAPEPAYASEAEYVALGFSLGELNLALAQQWQLPGLVAESSEALAADTRSPRSWAVGLASRLAALARQGWRHPEMPPLLDALSELLELDHEATQAEISAGAAEAAALLPWKPVTFAPLLTEGEEDGEARAPISETSDNPYLSDGTAKGGVCLAPRRAVFERVRSELETQDYARSEAQMRRRQGRVTPRDCILNLVVTGLYEGLGLSRVLYAQMLPDGETLAGRYVLGAAGDPNFHRFRVDLARPSLLQELMAKPAAVWLTPQRYQRVQHRIPPALHALADGRSAFLAAIFAGGQPQGMVYADRHRIDNALDEASFKAFRRLCALGGQRLAEL
ncbi:HDOD domain-containing protein [Halorhodospira halophila]|uniref:Putative signal transduction protein n=1 Tax=Halorhodospira halophila (strain DSM 244 / SL1) TaxID=349124 RepID=A1WTL0_HALHL|nr:HDOD domain-containing protein [Halorhodospira halophila]ABM61022.1 putative signal transduction protein [Halorhodospira halophila SL1]MBK1729969.1 HDOD domain-containing protein [Halorhodospira halophila]